MLSQHYLKERGKDMKRITKNREIEWARKHKTGTKVFDLTIAQYVQDENEVLFAVIPLKDLVKKDLGE